MAATANERKRAATARGAGFERRSSGTEDMVVWLMDDSWIGIAENSAFQLRVLNMREGRSRANPAGGQIRKTELNFAGFETTNDH
jgi:hypothetical protein